MVTASQNRFGNPTGSPKNYSIWLHIWCRWRLNASLATRNLYWRSIIVSESTWWKFPMTEYVAKTPQKRWKKFIRVLFEANVKLWLNLPKKLEIHVVYSYNFSHPSGYTQAKLSVALHLQNSKFSFSLNRCNYSQRVQSGTSACRQFVPPEICQSR